MGRAGAAGVTQRLRAEGRGRGPTSERVYRSPTLRKGGQSARARRSLDLGTVAPGALRSDWPTRPEEADGSPTLRPASAGVGGWRGSLLPLGLRRHRPDVPAAPRPAFLFGGRHKMAALRGGASARACGTPGRLPGLERAAAQRGARRDLHAAHVAREAQAGSLAGRAGVGPSPRAALRMLSPQRPACPPARTPTRPGWPRPALYPDQKERGGGWISCSKPETSRVLWRGPRAALRVDPGLHVPEGRVTGYAPTPFLGLGASGRVDLLPVAT